MNDERIQSLEEIIMNLQEYPADQTADFLVEASLLSAQLKALCDVEMLKRALGIDE